MTDTRNLRRGVKHHSAKMNATKVRQARKSYATGKYTIVALAQKYGISAQSMGALLKNRTWTHVV